MCSSSSTTRTRGWRAAGSVIVRRYRRAAQRVATVDLRITDFPATSQPIPSAVAARRPTLVGVVPARRRPWGRLGACRPPTAPVADDAALPPRRRAGRAHGRRPRGVRLRDVHVVRAFGVPARRQQSDRCGAVRRSRSRRPLRADEQHKADPPRQRRPRARRSSGRRTDRHVRRVAQPDRQDPAVGPVRIGVHDPTEVPEEPPDRPTPHGRLRSREAVSGACSRTRTAPVPPRATR